MQRTRPQLVEDKDRKLKIYPTDRFSLRYECGEAMLDIETEPLLTAGSDSYDMAVYLSNITYWTNVPDRPITAEEKETIQKDLKLGLTLLLDGGVPKFF